MMDFNVSDFRAKPPGQLTGFTPVGEYVELSINGQMKSYPAKTPVDITEPDYEVLTNAGVQISVIDDQREGE